MCKPRLLVLGVQISSLSCGAVYPRVTGPGSSQQDASNAHHLGTWVPEASVSLLSFYSAALSFLAVPIRALFLLSLSSFMENVYSGTWGQWVAWIFVPCSHRKKQFSAIHEDFVATILWFSSHIEPETVTFHMWLTIEFIIQCSWTQEGQEVKTEGAPIAWLGRNWWLLMSFWMEERAGKKPLSILRGLS